MCVTMSASQQDDSGRVHRRSQICCMERLSNQRADYLAEGTAGLAENCGRLWIPLWQVLVGGSDNSKFACDRVPPRGLACSSGCKRVSTRHCSVPMEVAAAYSCC